MSRNNPRTISPAVIVGGIVAVIVIIVGVILVRQMSRQTPEPPGYEHTRKDADEQTKPTVETEHEEGRTPRAETEQDHAKPEAEVTAPESEDSPTETQPATTEEEAPDKTAYAISGCVVDAKGEGVADATVQVRVQPDGTHPVANEAKTDHAGVFRLDDLPKQDLFVTAFHGDRHFYLPYLPSGRHQAWCFPIPHLPGRDHVTGIRLILQPTTDIAGKVVDIRGQPVANAAVSVLGLGASAETDSQGAFRITGIIPGKCRLNVKADGFLALFNEPATAGSDDVLFRLERGVTLQGNVVFAESGMPAPGAEVNSVVGYAQIDTATADEAGHFEILVHPETATKLRASGRGCILDPELVIENGGQDIPTPLTIELVRSGSISGIVRVRETELPVADVTVIARSPSERRVGATSDAEGKFLIEGLVPGPHVMSLYDGYDVRSSASEPDPTVDVVAGDVPSEIELWVSPRPTITGTVVTSQGAPIFAAAVAPRLKTQGYWSPGFGQSTLTAADGRFRIKDPGMPITGLMVSHPEYGHTLVELAQGTESGQSQDIRIVLQKEGGQISGQVKDSAGNPICRVQVRLLALDLERTGGAGPPELLRTLTDEQGRYVFGAVAAGTYRVRATACGQETESGEVVLAAGQKIDNVHLTAAPSGHFAGRVTNTDGEPVAGIRVNAQPEHATGVSSTHTDDDGRYRLENLVQGRRYTLLVDMASKGYQSGGYRSVTCSADDVDFVLTPMERCTLRGVVYHKADGSPVKQFRITLTTRRVDKYGGGGTATYFQDFVTADGSFECDAWPGELSFVVGAPGCAEFKSEPFQIKDGEESTHTIYLPQGATLRGVVTRKSDSGPVTKYHLRLVPQEKEPSPYVRMSDTRPYMQGQTVESDDGSYECASVDPGMHTIVIIAEGLPDFETEPFEIAAEGETVHNICIGDGCMIKGKVVDESHRPVPDAVIDESGTFSERRRLAGLSPDDTRRPKTPNRTTTNSAGEFVLRNLTPGTVSLRVEHPDYAEKEVRDIEVTEDAPTEDVVIVLEGGTVLYGWVKDADGKALVGTNIGIRGEDDRSFSVDVDHTGHYRSPHLARGTYKLKLSHPEAILPKIHIKGEDELEFNIDFAEAGTISGRVDLPTQPENVRAMIVLYGLDEMSGHKWTNVASDGTYELPGVFAGKYAIRVFVEVPEDETKQFDVTTSPKSVIVNVGVRDNVTRDITVTEITEAEPQ